MNLASSFVNGFVNAAFGQDKLLTDDGNKWLYATAPGGTDEKQGGKERRDAGDKDKEQELVRRGPGNRRRRPRAESRRLRRPRVRSPAASP